MHHEHSEAPLTRQASRHFHPYQLDAPSSKEQVAKAAAGAFRHPLSTIHAHV